MRVMAGFRALRALLLAPDCVMSNGLARIQVFDSPIGPILLEVPPIPADRSPRAAATNGAGDTATPTAAAIPTAFDALGR